MNRNTRHIQSTKRPEYAVCGRLWSTNNQTGKPCQNCVKKSVTRNPAVMGGMPCIRNTRIPVETVRDMLAQGLTDAEVLGAYPDLLAEDIALIRLDADM